MFEIFMMATNGAMCILSSISFAKLIYDSYNSYMHPEILAHNNNNINLEHITIIGDSADHHKAEM